MKVAFYTNLVSPHTVPLSEEVRKNVDSFVYVYQKHGGEPFRTRAVLESMQACAICEVDEPERARIHLRECDVLLSGVRDFDLMQERINKSMLTIYQSERWFKPESLLALGKSESSGRGVWVGGFWKMLLPFAVRRARRIMQLFKSEKFLYLPIGIHAARDMARLCGLMNGDWRCLFRAPKLKYEKQPFGMVELSAGNDGVRYGLNKMRMWGYFVKHSLSKDNKGSQRGDNTIKVLWVGRMLGLKNVDTVIRAVGGDERFELDIYGSGPEEKKLRKIASKYKNVSFGEMVPINEVRDLMRRHDVYVLPSNEFDGWGAVVNEALEEGMKVVGTYEAGASATILPESNLFHSGDWRTLRRMLASPIEDTGIGNWTARYAADKLITWVKKV